MKISVVIPTYNRGPRLQATVDSVLHQTLASDAFEVIIVDDGSTNGTAEWAGEHYASEPRVRVIAQTNTGVAGARNRGLQEARGEFIAYLDHDDFWVPSKLELQLEAIEGKPNVGVVYCLWNHVDVNGESIVDGLERSVGLRAIWPEGNVFARFLKRNFIVSMSVPLLRTELVRAVGGFDPSTVPCDDWDLWLRMAQKCEFAFVDAPLVNYFQHDEQQSRDHLKMLKASRATLRKYRWHLLTHPVALWVYLASPYFFHTFDPYYVAVRDAISQANWHQAKRQVRLCARRRPLFFLTPQWIYIFLRILRKDSRPF